MSEIILSSTVLILVICALRYLLKDKINLHLRYSLWLLVAIRLLPLSLLFSSLNIPFTSPISIATPITRHYDTVQNTLASQTINSPSSTLSQYSNDSQVSTRTLSITQLLTYIWIAGMCILFLWFLAVNLQFQHKISLHRKKQELSFPCKLPVYTTTGIHSPMLLMVHGRLGIYLTPDCLNNTNKIKHAITHELCHYKHLDHIWVLLRCIALIVYWFDPFVWIAAELSKRDCELACDASTLRMLGDQERLSYGHTILSIAKANSPHHSVLYVSTGFSNSTSGLKERIHKIIKKPKKLVLPCMFTLLIIILAIFVTFSSPLANETSAKKKSNANATQTSPTPKADLPYDLDKPKDENIWDKLSSGYYFDGQNYITPDGKIDSLDGFTDEILLKRCYGISMTGQTNSTGDHSFTEGFTTFDGVHYWLQLNATKQTSLTLHVKTNAKNDTLKVKALLPNNDLVDITLNAETALSLPAGTSDLVVVGYHASGKVEISYECKDSELNVTQTIIDF